MKNIRIWLFIMVILLPLRLIAQSAVIGVRGGISIPNLTNGSSNNPLSTGYSSRLASDFGIFGEYRLNQSLSIRIIIEYSEQGGKKNGLQALPTPSDLAQLLNQPYVYADYNSTAKMNYLLLPVLIKFGKYFRSQSPWQFYFDVGPFAAYLLSAHQLTSGTSPIYSDPEMQNQLTPPVSFDNKDNIRDELHHFNGGISGNIGLAWHFNNNSIFIEGGGNYGFINIQKNAINGKNHTGAATVSIGYSYGVSK
jgi:hypothetical protein